MGLGVDGAQAGARREQQEVAAVPRDETRGPVVREEPRGDPEEPRGGPLGHERPQDTEARDQDLPPA